MIPHLALPFRIINGAAVVNDQDTIEDVVACCEAIVRYPVGYRDELPEFGIHDLTFSPPGFPTVEIEAAISRWEPRADASVKEDSRWDELISNVSVPVSRRV